MEYFSAYPLFTARINKKPCTSIAEGFSRHLGLKYEFEICLMDKSSNMHLFVASRLSTQEVHRKFKDKYRYKMNR